MILVCREDRCVCASSKGLGFGCADALAAVGANLVMNARTPETSRAAARIRDAMVSR